MKWFEPRVLRSARPFVPSGGECRDGVGGTVDDQAMVQMMCDLIFGEIQAEISRVEKEAERRRQDELKLTNQPDYSWLMDWRLRAKRPLSFKECSELESLCSKVRPDEWRRLLKEWHTKVRFAESRYEVLDAFRTLVDEMVKQRMRRQCLVESVDEQHGGEDNNSAEEDKTTSAAEDFRVCSILPGRTGRLTGKEQVVRRLSAMRRAVIEGAQGRFSARLHGEVFYVRFY